jgi:tRNA 2-selenouridine synthase
MSAPIIETDKWVSSDYDMIIDVRSPSEFADDHIPGAVNMPVLSDEERAEIGTIYKQQSAYLARKKGAVMAARNIAAHIESKLQDKEPRFSPLIHCWRGGQRSRSFATICSEIGWKTYTLIGGYKSYRRAVLKGLEDIPATLSYIVIAGRTGSGKTDILTELTQKGAQVLDLENLAAHRGSLLGRMEDRPQPSQRYFESSLFAEISNFDAALPVYVESESSRIGDIQLPTDIWKQIVAAPMISINASRTARAEYLLDGYKGLTEDLSDLQKLVSGMVRRHGHERTNIWQGLIETENWQDLAVDLLETHYDPAYDKSILRHDRKLLAEITQQDCTPESLASTAGDILKLENR